MTPRSKIESLNVDDTVADLVLKAIETGFSRFPITAGDLDETGRSSVHLRANGQPVALRVIDVRAPVSAKVRPKADDGNPGHLGASVPGVITVLVRAGDQVRAGDRVAVIEAMKMESPVTATVAGTVDTVHVQDKSQVEPGDLVVAMTPTAPD